LFAAEASSFSALYAVKMPLNLRNIQFLNLVAGPERTLLTFQGTVDDSRADMNIPV